MKLRDYHTHCNLCNHAEGMLEDYVKAGIRSCLVEIGLSDHFPMTFLPEEFHVFAMSLDDFPNYINEAKRLREKYEDQIAVRIASEVDFVPDVFDEYKRALKPYMDDFDYIIGSVHGIADNGGHMFPVDIPQAVPRIKEIGVDNVYLEYYDMVIKMVKSGFYHVVGHFDLLKRSGLSPRDSDRVWQKALQVLDSIERTGMAVEINTSGLRNQANEQYPAERIIKELIQREIPVTFGSDAHRPADVGYNFRETAVKL